MKMAKFIRLLQLHARKHNRNDIVVLLMGLLCFSGFAFEWPMESKKINANFAELRGGEMNNSLVFSESENNDVKASDNGFVKAIIQDYEDDTDFFSSTFGNTIIVSHNDGILTVYGNLDKDTIENKKAEPKKISTGEVLAKTGKSAWKKSSDSLCFQMLDEKNNITINPRIILSQSAEKENALYPQDIVLKNRQGRNFRIREQNTLPQGYYRVYQKRPTAAMPYKMQIFVNGEVQEEIAFDVLRQDSDKLCVSGKKNYTKNELYPTSDTMMLGEIALASGKNSLRFVLVDILGKESFANYGVTNY